MVSYCVGISFILFVYVLYAVSLKTCNSKLYQVVSKKELLLVCFMTFFYIVCIFGILIRESYVYYWDYGAYWYWALGVQDRLFSDPLNALRELYVSVNTQEYNQILAFLIAIPLKLLGNSYLAFVILIAMMFLLPAMGLLALLIWEICQKYQIEDASFLQVYFMILSICVPLFPVLSGYIDVAALCPLLLCYLLTLKIEYAGRVEYFKCFLIGVLLVLTLIMRRYYGYAVVGYVLFLIGYVLFGDGIRNWKYGLKCKIMNITLTGLTAFFILIPFFRGFIIQSLFNNYAEAYSAYSVQTLGGNLKTFILHYGMAVISMALCSLICSYKNSRIGFVLPVFVSLIISMLLFYHVADMGEQHYYITVAPVVMLAVLGYEMLYELIEKSRCKACIVLFQVICMGVCALNFSFALGIIPKAADNAMFIQRTYKPKIRWDKSTLQLMEKEFEQLDAEGYRGVYVLASSDILNGDILYKLNAPLFEKGYQLQAAAQVDLRDGFNTDFFDADVIVVCDPLQVHLMPEDQSVISLLYSLFREDSDSAFTKKYKLFSNYTLDRDVEAYIYVKQQELQQSDIEYVRDLFEQRYDNYPELFLNRFNEYIYTHD